MINSEIYDAIVDWMSIGVVWVKILSASNTVADWIALDQVFLIELDISLPEWSQVFWSTCKGIFASWVCVRVTGWNRLCKSCWLSESCFRCSHSCIWCWEVVCFINWVSSLFPWTSCVFDTS